MDANDERDDCRKKRVAIEAVNVFTTGYEAALKQRQLYRL